MLELAGVDVDADAATVDLARAQLDEIQRRLGDVGLLGRVADLLKRLQAPGTVIAGLSIRACMIGPPWVVGVGMVEGVERVPSVHLELEAFVASRVEDANSDAARVLVPEQVDVDSAAHAVRQFGPFADRVHDHRSLFRPDGR
jgi:hypothetical protein